MKTRIETDIDFNKDGKQFSHLRVPFSRNQSAWGSLLIPIIVIKNGAGPTLLFTAGAHGDEYEGPLVLSKLAREFNPDDIDGRIIILPSKNLPALQKSKRLSPVDQKDMNRSYPGDRDGTPTQMITHYISSTLIPQADIVVDYHSGGRSLEFLPCVIMHKLKNEEQFQETHAALQAYGAPTGLILQELDDHGMIDTYIENLGIPFLTTEFSGGGTVTPKAMQIAERGTWNLLKHFGAISPRHEKFSQFRNEVTTTYEIPHSNYYTLAPEAGIFEPFFTLGDSIQKNKAVGQLHFLHNPQKEPLVLKAKESGTIIAKRVPALTEPGDCLVVIGK